MPEDSPQARVGRVLFSEDAIRARVSELVREIEASLDDGDLVIVALLKGSVVFLSDLIRGFERPVAFDFVGVASYGDGTSPGATLTFTKELSIDIAGRDVLLVDDILDTGRTMRHVIGYLRSFGPASLRICVLLDKRARRQAVIEPDYRGFEIGDQFVVGYGMDFADQFRNLPYIGVLAQNG
ncbi:MAG: hypoxanthine phosphoribosyltransferase [Verrucomicrobia bacterium]|nr:hypoxanthine phosphoribosyltransferase [Verrucomicrobiota bacterium]